MNAILTLSFFFLFFTNEPQVSGSSSAKLGLHIQSKVQQAKWRNAKAIYPVKGQPVQLRVKPNKRRTVENIRWYLIFADITKLYNNAVPPGEPNSYKWLGLDKIEYYRIEIADARGKSIISPKAFHKRLFEQIHQWFIQQGVSKQMLQYYRYDVGTFWYQVEGTVNGKPFRSPGISEQTKRGISKSVFRMSIKSSDSYLGWVSSFYNVPGLFGSIKYQSKNYIGADCADLLMSAWSKWRKKPLTQNYNVQMLLSKFKTVSTFQIIDGTPDAPIKWTKEVQPGDFIAVRYGNTGRKFHHIGTLYKDNNNNTILDGEDLILHAGPDPLHLSKIKHHSFDGHIIILRP